MGKVGGRARLEGAVGRLRSLDRTLPAKVGLFVHSRAVRCQVWALENACAHKVHGWECAEGGEQTWTLFLAFSSLQLFTIHLYQSPLLVLDISLPLSLFLLPLSFFLVPLTWVKEEAMGPFPRSYLLLVELTSEEPLWGLHPQNGQNLS